MQKDMQLSKEWQKGEKQEYEKPRIGKVQLVADQVLACFEPGSCTESPTLPTSG